MTHWQDKSVLITGGSSGLGFALARAFLNAGARVAIVGRDSLKLQTAVQQLGCAADRLLPVTGDITQADDVTAMVARVVETFGKLDCLVNNAGISMRGEILTTPPEAFERLWEVNFLGTLRCIQAAAAALLASQGTIINIGSLASKSASSFLGAYPASKFPVAALSQQLRLELAGRGVHVLLVCPGPLQREDAGSRYAEQTAGLPNEANKPGGGVKLKGLAVDDVARRILRAVEHRQVELVIPRKARLLFAIAQLWPRFGDWLLKRMT